MPNPKQRKPKEHNITIRSIQRDNPDLRQLAKAIIEMATAELAARQSRNKSSPTRTSRQPVVPTPQRDAGSSQRSSHTARSEPEPLTNPHQ